MKSQRNQLIALAVLLIIWAISWYAIRSPRPIPAVVITAKTERAAAQDSLLQTRFHKVRAEMDGLYHYRIKPAPFDPQWNPFRMPAIMLVSLGGKAAQAAVTDLSKAVPTNAQPPSIAAPETGDVLLAHAIAAMRIGGVVTMNGMTQLTVEGQLHKEGDVFTTKVYSRVVLIRIKHLSTASVTLALDDPSAGTAEARVRLK
jgi:hypothetical protein